MKYSSEADISYLGLTCEPNTAKITGSVTVTGTLTLGPDSRYTEATVTKGNETWGLDKSCLNLSGTKVSCSRVGEVFLETLKPFGYDGMSCENNDSTGGCNCQASINREGGMGILYDDVKKTGKYTKGSDNTLKIGDTLTYSYCVNGSEMTAIPNPDRGTPYKGSIVLTKKPDGTGGTGGSSATGTGGKAGSGGGGTGGAVTSGGNKAGTVAGGTSAVGGSAAGGSSSVPQCTGTSCGKEGPCDIYAAASMPCATAYSMVRVLSKNYTGPLFQVRAGSSSTNNTMSGGTTKDISPGPDGYVTTEMVDAACSGYCTVSKLYDQSGNANHLMRAPKGSTAGGAKGAMDDYESIATKGVVKAGGHESYTLYMNLYEGYRSQVGVPGNKMPVKQEPMGIYLLADGTRKGTACCWDFGNATNTPATGWYFMDAIAFGTTWWGKGAGSGPWFGIDFEGGVWAGGTKVGDPGYGALDKVGPPNTKNPSMDQANFALGFTKVKTTEWAIRVADLAKNNELIEAWKGPLPEGSIAMNHQGGIILGMGGDNSNNSKGTFIEGAMVAGYPTPELEAKVMENIKAVGYAVVAH